MTFPRAVFIVAVWAVLTGCAISRPSGDPLIELASRAEVTHTRLDALKEAQTQASADPVRKTACQRVYRDIAWNNAEPVPLRLAVLEALVGDTDPAGAKEARETCKLMLPRERSLEVVRFICRNAAERKWDDCIPSLIRSYSRTPASVGWTGVDEEQHRPERAALELLSNGTPVERVVFQVFLKPPELAATYGMDWAQRFRANAWDLLARLDKDGALRVSMLSALPEESADDLVKGIRKCVHDLRAMPLAGDELKWLSALLDVKKPANQVWWAEAAGAIAAVGEDGRKGVLALRHAEAIRWAAKAHPEWLQSSRQELLSELRTRIAGRTIHERTAQQGRYRVRESLDQWEGRLRWGDLVSILAIDEAVREQKVVLALRTPAELDRKDTTTEYGGGPMRASTLPSGAAAKGPDEWIAMLFPPRAGQRQGDEKF